MINAILVCAAGMSTSMLMKKIKEVAVNKKIDLIISAHSISEVKKVAENADVVLLGPQVRFQLERVKEQVSCPVAAIDSSAYGMMNGEKVLQQILDLVSN